MRDGVDGEWTYPAAHVSGDAGVLGQILAAVTSLSERMAVVETDLKTLVRDSRADIADHESRLRDLEAKRPGLLTRVDYEADRAARTRRMLWAFGLGIPTLVALIVPLEAVVFSRIFG